MNCGYDFKTILDNSCNMSQNYNLLFVTTQNLLNLTLGTSLDSLYIFKC